LGFKAKCSKVWWKNINELSFHSRNSSSSVENRHSNQTGRAREREREEMKIGNTNRTRFVSLVGLWIWVWSSGALWDFEKHLSVSSRGVEIWPLHEQGTQYLHKTKNIYKRDGSNLHFVINMDGMSIFYFFIFLKNNDSMLLKYLIFHHFTYMVKWASLLFEFFYF
jgi:hypothetical protein